MEKEYRKFTEEQIKETCEAHEKWLASGGKEGERADFHNADLAGARLEGVNLEKANLKDARLKGAFLNFANLKEASLEYADFKEAILTSSTFEDARLAFANFEESKLGHVNFTGASLGAANFAYAAICGCHFREAFIGGAKWTSIANADFDDKQIKEFAYQLCWAALASSDTSAYVKDEIRKIVRLANCSNSAKEWGCVQEYRNKKYVTAKEA